MKNQYQMFLIDCNNPVCAQKRIQLHKLKCTVVQRETNIMTFRIGGLLLIFHGRENDYDLNKYPI